MGVTFSTVHLSHVLLCHYNPSVDSAPQDELEAERPRSVSNPQGRGPVGSNGITSWIFWKNGCQAPRRPLDKSHLQLEPSDINRTERRCRKQGRPGQRLEDDINLYLRAKSTDTTTISRTTRLAHRGTRRLEMERQPNQQQSKKQHTHTTKAHDHDEGGNSDDDDESPLILSQPIES